MKLRLISTAMLFNGNDLLMMKRAPGRSISPGVWAAVGGHLEADELSDPRGACLREIREETGLEESDLENLTLQYIVIRLKGAEIRQQFVYAGRALKRNTVPNGEGDLHWIPCGEALDRELPFVYRTLLEHYFTNGPSRHVRVATAGWSGEDKEGAPTMRWAPLLDPLVD